MPFHNPEVTEKPRIHADFNGYHRDDEFDFVELDTMATLIDLHRLQIRLTEGLEIMAWDQSDENEDMEVVGTCHYQVTFGRARWCVRFPRGALVYVPRRNESPSHQFICFQCRQPLPEMRVPGDQVCAHCGLPINFPWQPPASARQPAQKQRPKL
jgi:hypothetical protein